MPKKRAKRLQKPQSKKSKGGKSTPKSAQPTRKHRRDPRRQIHDIPETPPEGNHYVYGIHAVMNALQDPAYIQKIYVDKALPSKRRRDIESQARQHSITVQHVPKSKLDSLADHHQGVIALIISQPLQTLTEWLESVQDMVNNNTGVVIALDEVTDPHNIGAVIRVAESLGCLGVILPRHRSGVLSPVVSKVSAGADQWLPLVQVTNLAQSLTRLKESGFWILGTEIQEDTPAFQEIDYSQLPTVIVLGSEGKGIRPGVKQVCDMTGYIPLSGNTQSLNVSTAAAIFLYEITLQQNQNI